MPCSRQLAHDWTFRKRVKVGHAVCGDGGGGGGPVEDTCASYRTSAILRMFTRRKDEAKDIPGYSNVFEGNPPDVSQEPTPSVGPRTPSMMVSGFTGTKPSMPTALPVPTEPETSMKRGSSRFSKGQRGSKHDPWEPRPSMMRLWQMEFRFLERRGIHVKTPIFAISPIAAARAALREPPCPVIVHGMKSAKKGRYSPMRRMPRTVEKSKTSRPKPPEKEGHKMATRCGPDTLCTYLAKNSVYRPLANALLRLYVERPDKPAALERLRIMMGDPRPDMEGFQAMKKELDRIQEELHVYMAENVNLKRQLDILDKLRRRKTRKNIVETKEMIHK